MLSGDFDPLLHWASTRGVKEPCASEGKRFGVPGSTKLEDHRAVVEPGKRLSMIFEQGMPNIDPLVAEDEAIISETTASYSARGSEDITVLTSLLSF